MRSGNEWRSMLAYPLAVWFLLEFLNMPIHSYSQASSPASTALQASWVAVVRYSNSWYDEDNAVPPPRARFDLFQLRLVYQSPSNVVVMRTLASLHWGGMLWPLQNSAVRLCVGSLLEEASTRTCISRVQLKLRRGY